MKLNMVPRGFCPNCCPVHSHRDIRFVYYNRTNARRGSDVAALRPGEARKIGIDRERATEIFIHGFTEPSPGESGRTIIDGRFDRIIPQILIIYYVFIITAYLSRAEKFNVILLDWSELGAFPWYTMAVNNVKLVADSLKNFLETFHDSGEIPIGNVHLIGFSLGAHIAAFAGKLLRNGLRIPRITALDPALPEFSLTGR